ncbi:acyltransferase [Frigidibacter sp. MR17.14]|uniref:acyltransferase family protein n=1 Tax=Frigidibacter sp. MR17.14 TaxID=3126509 RepID=UPI0030130C4A
MTEPASLFRHAHLRRQSSDAIRMARVICILSMITVHFWPGAGRILDEAQPGWAHPVYLVLVDYLGRSSVPLLSMISGALLVLSVRRGPPPLQTIRHKLRMLIGPMVVWSAALLGLYLLHAAATGDMSRLPQGPMGWINALFALTAPPANLPLAFLRDTFVCATIAALSLALARRSPATGLMLTVAAFALMLALPGTLILRPQIAWFYLAGVILALTGQLNRSLPSGLVLALFLADSLGRNVFAADLGRAGLEWLDRIAMSLLVWKVCEAIVRHLPAVFARMRRLEPYVFTLFCSHMLVVTAIAGIAGPLKLSETSDSYLAVFLLQYPATLALAVLVVHLRRYWAQRRTLSQPLEL